MIANLNDGSGGAPRLRVDLHLGSIWDLPAWSTGPRTSDMRAIHEAIAEAGFGGVQGGDPKLCDELGLGCTAFGVMRERGALMEQAKAWRDAGNECSTLHVGSGIESDDDADRLLDEVLEVSMTTGLPLYIETHRATLTQDTWRTVQLVERFPDLRFNGDFSHWYTGLEMTYGDFDAKLAHLAPVFERTRFLHGRIGDPGCIQIPVDVVGDAPSIDHFRQFWTAAFRGFRSSAAPGDFIVFAPELLPAVINYARTVPDGDGARVEEGDRWVQAARLADIARSCFDAAGPSVE